MAMSFSASEAQTAWQPAPSLLVGKSEANRLVRGLFSSIQSRTSTGG